MNYDSNLDRLTVTDLRAIAAELKIAGRSKMKRAELVAAITRAEAGVNRDADEQDDAEARELLDAALGEYVEPTGSQGRIAITKYSAHEAIATAAFDVDSIGGRVTRERGRWVLRDGKHTIRAKTLGKAGKLWAKTLGIYATTIEVDRMN